ncbi:phosphodiester glycosidase family protein [Flindersiella endophytica]
MTISTVWWRRLAFGAAFATLGALAVPVPAGAGQAPAQPAPVPPSSQASTSDAELYGLTTGQRTRAATTEAVEPRLETYSASRPVAPGVTLRSFDRYGPDAYSGTPNWLQSDSLTVDLTKGATVDYLFPGRVAAGEPISTQASRVGAVAAVNGDFFDINNSNAPLGVGIKHGELLQSPGTDPAWRQSAAIFTPDGIGSIGEVFFEGTITLPGGSTPLTGLNKTALPADGIEAFTPVWGTYCRCRVTQGVARVTEVEVRNNHVTAVRQAAGEGEIPSDGFVLVGREAGADRLAQLAVGDPVSIDYQARTDDGARIQAAINGRQLLVVNGVAQQASQGNNIPPAPRTAVGFSQDGKKMFLLTADGRQPAFSDGLGLDELAQMMVELGAYNAVNLDGGGSTTIIARKPGATTGRVENVPSDGRERNDPNGLGLFAPKGSGRLTGFWVETALDPTRATGSSTIALARPERVFPGFSRRLTAAGYDETYGPAAGTPRWAESGDAGTVNSSGVFRATRPGQATVTASKGQAHGSAKLTVLQPATRIGATTEQVTLTGSGAMSTFGVLGYDRTGSSAPFEPSEVSFSYDTSLLDITTDANGTFVVTAKQASGSSLVTVQAGSLATVVPVTVGLEEVLISDFEDASKWSFFGERATGTVSSAPGKEGNGLRLTYDFASTTEIRTGGATPTQTLAIPGQPRALRLWVNSSAKGEWASMQVYDATGALLPAFRAGYLTGTGWQQLEFPVPAGTQYPLTFRRYYSAETVATKQYQGDIVIDQLTALVPPSIDVPAAPKVEDPVVVQDGTLDDSSWRFAVMSDAQFVARSPDSDIVKQARRTLREVLAQHPDFLVINGDLVDEASVADFELARRVIDEELQGRLPYYYVPGNHERFAGTLDNFKAAFGATQNVFDHKGTRFLTFDSSGISIRASDWTQLRTLRTQLDAAARDRSVKSVVVLQHVPPDDPTPAKASQLSDRKEALTIQNWLAGFEHTSGKQAAFVGAHVGTFHATSVDGVPYVVNGNSGKNPSTAPADGGFTGWSLWGVRGADVRVEIRPHVDALTLNAPTTLQAGRSADVSATLTQGSRVVPVAYPVSADWSGSPNLHVGSKSGLRPWHTA